MSLSNIEMAPAEASAALKQLKYRADIDGLRAIAIIPVVLYHAGIQAFGGGFVGVDIFFVISGYLITAVIASDIRAGLGRIGTVFLWHLPCASPVPRGPIAFRFRGMAL